MFNKDKFKELAKERDNTDWDCKIDKIWSEMLSMILCKCQYKNAQKVEYKNVHFSKIYSSA